MQTIRTATASALAFGLTFSASAVTINPFDALLSVGDGTSGSIVADSGEDFASAASPSISFTTADALDADVTITINPYNATDGQPNEIEVSYAINAGAPIGLTVTEVPVLPTFSIGAAALELNGLAPGDTVTFFVDGTAGISGNQVTFAVETVPEPGTAALALLGFAACTLRRRR